MRHAKVFCLVAALVGATQVAAQRQDSASIAWSDYPGWRMITDSLSDAIFGVGPFTQDRAVDLYLRGVADILAISNIDLIQLIATNPSAPDTVILFPTSTSEGADKIVASEGIDPSNLTGRRVGLVRNSSSHFLYSHAARTRFDGNPILIFMDEAELVDAFVAGRVDVVVGREPMISEAENIEGARVISDSLDINHAIVDLIVMRRDVYERTPELARRLVAGWFENFSEADDGTVRVANNFERQQLPNRFFIEGHGISRRGFATPEGAVDMVQSGRLRFAVSRAKNFIDRNSPAVPGMPSLGDYGIRFSDGRILGNPLNVRIEFRTEHLVPPAPDG